MKNYDLLPQEKDTYCLCAILQAILERHRILISQGEIADKLTPADEGFLAHDERIRDFLRSNGFAYYFYLHNQTPFNEPDTVLRDMQDNEGIIGMGKYRYHSYLLNRFEDPQLEMINPGDNTILRTDIYSLLREMEESEGFFGLIKRLQ